MHSRFGRHDRLARHSRQVQCRWVALLLFLSGNLHVASASPPPLQAPRLITAPTHSSIDEINSAPGAFANSPVLSTSEADSEHADSGGALGQEKDRQFELIRRRLLYLILDRSPQTSRGAVRNLKDNSAPPPPSASVIPKTSPVAADENSSLPPPNSSEGENSAREHSTFVPPAPQERETEPPNGHSPEDSLHAPKDSSPSQVVPPDYAPGVDHLEPHDPPNSGTEEMESDSLPPVVQGHVSAGAGNSTSHPHVDSLPHQNGALGPIDRVGLGDALYATGETQLALVAYLEVNMETLATGDALWVSYQVASCQRRLGELDTALSGYRNVAERDAQGWLGGLSQWWMDNLQERQEVKEVSVRLTQRLQELEKQCADITSP